MVEDGRLSIEEFDRIMSASRHRAELDLRIVNKHSWWNNGFKELTPDAPIYARRAESYVLLRGQYCGMSYQDYLAEV